MASSKTILRMDSARVDSSKNGPTVTRTGGPEGGSTTATFQLMEFPSHCHWDTGDIRWAPGLSSSLLHSANTGASPKSSLMHSDTTLHSMRPGTTPTQLLSYSSPSSRMPRLPSMDKMVKMEPDPASSRDTYSKPTSSRATSQRESRERARDKLWGELGAVAEDVAGAGARA